MLDRIEDLQTPGKLADHVALVFGWAAGEAGGLPTRPGILSCDERR